MTDKYDIVIDMKTIISNDAQLVNFREIRMGKIAPKILYRSSHPVKDNKQEPIISVLANKARIATVINLSDTMSGIYTKAFFAPWYNRLVQINRVIAVGMDFSYSSQGFKRKLKESLEFMLRTEGPWLIHCHAGVDRTGFVSMVLEALMGASVDEIVNDYLLSFNSIFDSSIHSTNKTDALVPMQLLSAMGGSQIITDQNLQSIAENYLRNTIKLSVEELDALKSKLAGTLVISNSMIG